MNSATATCPSPHEELPASLLPLRGEAFGSEHMDAHFRELSSVLLVVSGGARTDRDFSARFEENAARIAEIYAAMIEAVRASEVVPAEAEWLLDNYYIVEEQLREIRDDLPRGYYRELPKTKSGYPRVYELARDLVIHTDSSLDGGMIERCVQQFQTGSPLSIGEVWAVPIMLRLVLVENLRRLSEQMLLTHACRRTACSMLDRWQPETNFALPLHVSPQCLPTIIQLFEQIPERSAEYRQATRILESQINERGWNVAELVHREHQRQASNQVSIGNVITSMRLLAGMEWVEFFEKVNYADQVLRRDPVGVYPEMNFASRDHYRHVVEELAKRTKRSDIEVAELAIASAEACVQRSFDAPGETSRQAHVGYWLIDAGRRQLERELGYRPPLHRVVRHTMLRWPHLTYFGLLGSLTLLLALGVAFGCFALALPLWAGVLLTLCAIFPASEVAQTITNLIVTNTLPPRVLPMIEFKQGVPLEYPTIVVVPSMLSSEREVDSLLDRLESHYLANSDEALLFALLTDFTDAPQEQMPNDAALVERAIAGIKRLNDQYQQGPRRPFYLLHRRRQWNASENAWMGWERKRGKLMEFGKFLQGDAQTSYSTQEGDLAALQKFRQRGYTPFVITLDSDTQLPHGAARELIGTLAHPLNRPQFSADHSRVTAGYTILQPRVNVHLAGAGKSWFAKIFAGAPGVDPYVTAASDVYQDLFGEGSFTGKGIYDLHAFERALDGAFPENAILSHDLIEGCHARVGLVSNIEVYDGYPTRLDAESRRAHRWVRGDWQILPWLLPYVPYASGWKRNPLSMLSRWKVFDNLRRSLVAPTLFAVLLLTWFVIPTYAWVGTLIAAGVLAFPLISQLTLIVRNWPWTESFRDHLRAISGDVFNTFCQCVLTAAFLPHKAFSMLDAIGRTLGRMLITKRKLLEWETAAAVEGRVSKSRWSIMKQLWMLPAIALLTAVLLPTSALLAAAPLLLLWLVAPAIAYVISQPIPVRRSECNESQQAWLRHMASETWSFFEAFVGPKDNWLPVDNIQEEPTEKVAHRLSPTNEGLFLLSGLAAHDFGYIGAHRLAALWENNLTSLRQLDKLNGHFYNWYDTETLRPLHPRYVSTVDSGNLAACLLTMQEGIGDLLKTPLLSPTQLRGMSDTLSLLEQACQITSEKDAPPLKALRQQVLKGTQDLKALLMLRQDDSASWRQTFEIVRQYLAFLVVPTSLKEKDDRSRNFIRKICIVHDRLQSLCDDAQQLFAWMPVAEEMTDESEHELPGLNSTINDEDRKSFADIWREMEQTLDRQRTLHQISGLAHTMRPFLDQLQPWADRGLRKTAFEILKAAIARSTQAATDLLGRYQRLAGIAENLAMSMDFRFLYNSQRRLFSIGYNIEEERLDRSHYDMLCSEARLASQLAIAKGDVETAHWFQLGRHSTIAAGKFALLSWGGTMFEYLMPPLFQKQYEGSLLTQSCRVAVLRQQEFGKQNDVPWGISESAFGALAINADYHYRSFGVPGLGLKRGLSKDLVISPYSSFLALSVDPAGAADNLAELSHEGGLGEWGFYDALDYTPDRVPFGKRRIVVRCYMAHHQGMSMLALANLLLEGNVQRRFNTHPLARATELLLQERVPTVMTPFEVHTDEVEQVEIQQVPKQLVSRRLVGWQNSPPRTHLLSNGQYSVMLSNAGGGYSRCRELDISRWRSDPTLDQWGQYIYVRQIENDQIWSPTFQPTCIEPDLYEVIFSIDKAEFYRRQGDLETLLEVAVSPENNAEVRQLRITNHSSRAKRLQLTSYAEIALNAPAADLAHLAFQKLFLETEFIKESSALLARRRPRDAGQAPQWAVHVLAASSDLGETVEFETSRPAFLGRRGSVRNPQAVHADRLAGTAGAVLDPVFSLRCAVTVPAGGSVTVAYSTAMAATREEALALADQYHELRSVQRVFELAWAYTQVELRHQHLSPGQVHLYQRLASQLLYPSQTMRGDTSMLRANKFGQTALWRHGISGDLPILMARVTEPEHIALVRDLCLAHRFWRDRVFRCDFIIINDYPGSYLDALQDQLVGLMQEMNVANDHKPGKIYLLRGPHLTPEEHTLFETVAACVLHGDRGTLSQQIDVANQQANATALYAEPQSSLKNPKLKRTSNNWPQVPSNEIAPLEFWNGYGGFANDGREYRVRLRPGELPPMPWSHVVANPRVGFVVTESGGGFSWFENSRENKLTTWSNDPVVDPASEMLYVRDADTGEHWMPLAGEEGNSNQAWAHYGAGYAKFVRQGVSIDQEVTLSVAKDDPVKFIRLKIKNLSSRTRTLTVGYYAELVLGVAREQTNLHLQTSFDQQTQALFARNPYHPEYAEQVAFLKVLHRTTGYTADRAEFLGRNGDWQRPRGAISGVLQSRTGVGLDPCAAVQTQITLKGQQTAEVIFLLGAGKSEQEARDVLDRYSSPEAVAAAETKNLAEWSDVLQTVQVKTPNRGLDILVNHWLLYQTICCRMWARSAFYQCGGAYGFRDQLQDSMAIVYSRPKLVREHMLRAAARQYRQGDVQHWWHPPLGKGTRTRFSDDLLWMPFAVSHYVRVTGDKSVLEEQITFIESPPLQAEEHERYEQPKVVADSASLYEHCLLAIEQGLRFGPHGLPLMGCGDWNDGMNKVGEGGTGESVWVGWFMLVLLEDFMPLLRERNDHERIARYELTMQKLRESLESQAWDGGWYRRAYFDDGTPLGSSTNDECQIDSLAQTWAVFAKANAQRAKQGMDAAMRRLVDRKHGLVLLFTPPFDQGQLDPGYIKGYLPGIRENGGQYTHAATWMVQALAQLGEQEQAMSVFDLINPIFHAKSPAEVAKYQVEPYVVAADVYGAPPHQGRGGWTWYTGSASWLYRVAIEQLLGLKLVGDVATLRPCVPASWSEFEVSIRRNGSQHKIQACRAHKPAAMPGDAPFNSANIETSSIDLAQANGQPSILPILRAAPPVK